MGKSQLMQFDKINCCQWSTIMKVRCAGLIRSLIPRPRLQDKIWEWLGDEATGIIHATNEVNLRGKILVLEELQ